uniref:C2H2-type domain-containing protein n=2 Tax=Cacopsylla melanoneura TaxID=428564 RepID=A0A8D8V7F3_9HEMI
MKTSFNLLTKLLLGLSVNLGLTLDVKLEPLNLAKQPIGKTLLEPLLRGKRDIYNQSNVATDTRELVELNRRADEWAYAQREEHEKTTEWEPILYRFTTEASAEVARMQTFYKELDEFVRNYRYNVGRTTQDTRPENPDDTWALNRPKLKGDMVGKPFHDPPWRIDQLKYLHCHIDDCKAWFNKTHYKDYVLHMYNHFFIERNFYVTWPPYIKEQNFTCYNKSCQQSFNEPGDFFDHVHTHLIEEDVTERTLFTTELTIGMAEFFSNTPKTTPKSYAMRKCYMCDYQSYSQDEHDKHIIKHVFNGSYYHTAKRQTFPPPQCQICDIKFSSEAKHEMHRKGVHPKPGIHLKRYKEYYAHDTRNNPDPEGFFCPMCPKRYFLAYRMENHIRWHCRNSPPEELLPPKVPNLAFVVFGETTTDLLNTTAFETIYDPPSIQAQIAQCKQELDEIDRKHTTPVYPQPEYMDDQSCLTSEREDSKTIEHKVPLTEELMDMDKDTSRYLEFSIRKPPKFCKTCHFITNDTLEFNRHYNKHCWDVAVKKLNLRSAIYDKMDKLYEEADKIRLGIITTKAPIHKRSVTELSNNEVVQLEEGKLNLREKRDLNEPFKLSFGRNAGEPQETWELAMVQELKKIKEDREEKERQKRDLNEDKTQEQNAVAAAVAESKEILERQKRNLRKKRELDIKKIILELKRSMYTIPFEQGQACENCNETGFQDSDEYARHVKGHIGNFSFFDQALPSPPTPYKSLEITGVYTTKARNGSEEERYKNVGHDIINDFQDFEIARMQGRDNRTREQFRRDRAIELGLRYGLLRTRKTTLPPPPPPPNSEEVKKQLNKKLQDVKEKLKQYQERKNKGNKENQTDVSKEIDHKVNDLKKKMEDIKAKYNCSQRRVKRSPKSKIPKDKIKTQYEAEMKQKEKKAKRMGVTLFDATKAMYDLYGKDLFDTIAPPGGKKNRGKREMPADILEDFNRIKNGTFLKRHDENIPAISTTNKPTKKKTPTTTTETPYPTMYEFSNGTTIHLLGILNILKNKVGNVLDLYKQIHNLKGVQWNEEILKKYNMSERYREQKEKDAKLNKTELFARMAQMEYFDQWDENDTLATTIYYPTLSAADIKRREEEIEDMKIKFKAMKEDLHKVIMKHFTHEELAKMDPSMRSKIEDVVEIKISTNPAKRRRRNAETTWAFTPRPFFELCSECTQNFTQKTHYFKHEFEHILNETFLAQAQVTMNAEQRYEQWKAERDNKTVSPLNLENLFKGSTIPVFRDDANVEDMKKYFITRIYELSSRKHHDLHMPVKQALQQEYDKYNETYWEKWTHEPVNRTEIEEVFRRVKLYYANQDRLEKEKEERAAKERAEAERGGRRKRSIE